MKTLITTPQIQRSLKGSFNHFIDLKPILQSLEMILDLFKIQMEFENYPEMRRLSKLRAREDKKLRKAKTHNFTAGLKWSMLRRPAWRKNVLETLGGDPALERWEARYRKAEIKASAPIAPRIYKRPDLEALRAGTVTLAPTRTAFDIKTDSTGVFRLAPIPRGQAKTHNEDGFELYDWEREERKEARALRAELRAKAAADNDDEDDKPKLKGYWYKDDAANIIYRMRPIPLLPDELRGVGIDDVDADDKDSEFVGKLINLGCPVEPLGLPDDTNNPHPEATHSVGTLRAGIMATDPSRRGCAAPQDEENGETCNNKRKTLILRRPKAVSKDEDSDDTDNEQPP